MRENDGESKMINEKGIRKETYNLMFPVRIILHTVPRIIILEVVHTFVHISERSPTPTADAGVYLYHVCTQYRCAISLYLHAHRQTYTRIRLLV